MTVIQQLFIVCPLVFLGGLVDSVAGGGGLISLPAYLVAGVPPHMALGSNKCSSAFGTLVASIRFFMHGKADLKVAGISVICALFGSAAGAKIVLFISPEIVRYILLFLIPVIASIVFMKKNFGEENRNHEISRIKTYGYAIMAGGFIGFYDGFFGPGTGTFLVLIYAVLLRYDLVTSTGNAKFVNLASNVGAFATFALNGQVDYKLAIPAAFFGIAGNFIGSGMAIKKGAKVIRPMFLIALSLLLFTMIKDLFF